MYKFQNNLDSNNIKFFNNKYFSFLNHDSINIKFVYDKVSYYENVSLYFIINTRKRILLNY